MSSQTAVFVRFPSGFSEVTYAAETPDVGDVLKRGKHQWRVTAVEIDKNGCAVVTLAPIDTEDRPTPT